MATTKKKAAKKTPAKTTAAKKTPAKTAAAKNTPEISHRLIIQPDEGTPPVVDLINGAAKSLRVKQFTLTDSAVMSALIRAHQRRVDVRIMLNPHRSSGDRANDESFKALRHAGLTVEWSNPAFAVTHEKSMVVDESVALISTFNYATKYFTETRDYGIVTDRADQVAEVVAGFEADWHRKPFQPNSESGLLWSSNNSRQLMAWFIDTAE